MTDLRLSPGMRVGALVAGALMCLMAAGIFAQLIVLMDANDRIHAQDEKIADLKRDAEPVLDAVRPLIGEARPLVREARSLADPLGQTADELGAAARSAPQVVNAVRTAVGEALPLVEALRLTVPEARALLPRVGAVLPELQALLPELRALIPQAAAFLDEAERRALLARADAAISATLDLESIQRRSLRIIERQLGIQQETLAVQLEALEHIESIDRKTGGEVPPGGG